MEHNSVAVGCLGAEAIRPSCISTRPIRGCLAVGLPPSCLALLFLRAFPSLFVAEVATKMHIPSFALRTRFLDCMGEVLGRERVFVSEAVHNAPCAIELEPVRVRSYELVKNLSRC